MKSQLWIVAPKGLYRSALCCLFCEEFQVSEYSPDFDHLLDPDGATGPLLVLVTAPPDPGPIFWEKIEALCSRTDTMVLVLADSLHLAEMRLALRAGVKGYLLATIAPEALRQSILVMAAGEKILPTALAEILRAGQGLHSPPAAQASLKLSPIDMKIFESLSKGRPNNGIAVDLGVSSMIIKARLKSIFKRLGVSNRTEAAIWILHNYAVFGRKERGTNFGFAEPGE